MNIRLFTAEASLYPHIGTYRGVSLAHRGSDVTPQLHCDDACLDACGNACPYPGEVPGLPPGAIIRCRAACVRECCTR